MGQHSSAFWVGAALEMRQAQGDDRRTAEPRPPHCHACDAILDHRTALDQFAALLPQRRDTHPLGCHRPRIPDRVIFDKLIQVLVFGCAYGRIADHTCSERTLRRRRDEWIGIGIMAQLEDVAHDGYDRIVGLKLYDLAVDGCITKAPCGGQAAGRSPVDRGKQGLKRSVVTDGDGIPLGAVVAGANTHDSLLLTPTLDTLGHMGPAARAAHGAPGPWL